MSETATMEAPAAAPVATPAAEPAAAPAQFTPPPHQVPGLLSAAPPGAPSETAASTPSGAPASVPEQAAPLSTPSDAEIPSPQWSQLIERNPELKPYEKRLAHLGDTSDPAEFAKALAKGYGEAVAYKSILVPGAEASDQDVAQFRKVNGLPAEAKDYKLSEATEKRFEALGVKDPATKAIYTEAFHKANATPAQVEAFSEAHEKAVSKLVADQQYEMETAQKANVEGLQKEWGERFNPNLGDVKELFAIAKGGVQFTESEQAELAKLEDSTVLVKLLHSIRKRIPGESEIHKGSEGIRQSSHSRLAAFKDAIMNDPKNQHPFNNYTHRDHAKAHEEFDRLQKEAQGY